MEKILSRSFLLLELLGYLSYKDIVEIRRISKLYKIKIDSMNTWEHIINRDYPWVTFIEHVPPSDSLQILTALINKKPITNTKFNVGIIGGLGRLEPDINDSYNLSKIGFLGLIKDFVSKNGIYSISLVSIPIAMLLECHSRTFSTFLLLSDCNHDWEQRLKAMISKCEEFCIKRIVIVANSSEKNSLLEEISNKYIVILANTLSRDNIRKCLIALEEALLNPAP